MSNARAVVVKLLTKLENNNSYSNILLSDTLSRSDLSPLDKKFASALFYGVIERKLTLDEIISDLSSNRSQKLNIEVRNILRCGLYQLAYMDSIPDNAAVDESVKLAKGNKNPAASGFVNAILREFIRKDKALPKRKDRFEQLSIEYSCPLWLVKKWINEYGERVCVSMLKTSLGQAPTTVRINTVHDSFENICKSLENEGIRVVKSKYLTNCAELHFSGTVENTEAYKAGKLHVQDISSQFCALAVEANENDTVLDVCAAPGGKSFTIAETMNDKGSVYSFDLHENRVKLIRSGAERLGLTCIKAEANDAKKYRETMPQADRVLCDVPCSGLGVIRRKPEIKYKSQDEFTRLPQIQYDILDVSSKYVKVGGILVYSTCTLSKAENDEVADRFLKEHKDFEPCFLGEAFGKYKNDTRMTFTPETFGSDGFFTAKFKRIR